MSGLLGIVDFSRDLDLDPVIDRMGRALLHREWYVTNAHVDALCGVGLGRVGIGIFNAEPQPVFSEDHEVVLLLSGEFYYADDARRDLERKGVCLRDASDAELALRLYQARGTDLIYALEGVFVLVVWDRARRRLILANDRLGLRPTYLAQRDGRFFFAPEIKSILASGAIPRTLDLTAVGEYVRYQMLLGDKTFFQGVTLMPPATLLSVDLDARAVSARTYWDWRSIRPIENRLDPRQAAEETERLLRRAINERLKRAARPGVFLSGGLDSRSVVALADRRYHPLTTITFGQRDCRDVHLAARVARAAGTRHHFFELKDGSWVTDVADFHLELTEGAHSWIHAHGLSALPRVRELIDVNLSGYGSGGLTGRFERPEMVYAPDEEAFVTAMFDYYTQRHSWPGLTEVEAQGLYADAYSTMMRGLALRSLRSELARYDHPHPRLRSYFFNLYNHDRRMILNFVIFNNSHIETRAPFADYAVIEWSARLPIEFKINKPLHRAILTRTAPRLALIPWDKNYQLPMTVWPMWAAHAAFNRARNIAHQRLKIGRARPTLYADYENYLRGELRGWGERILFDPRTLARGLFRPEAVRSLWQRHLSGREEWTIGKLAPLMTLEMMLRRFYDEPDPVASSDPLTSDSSETA